MILSILNIIVWYLTIGCIFTLIVDWASDHARKHWKDHGIEIQDDLEWNNESRLLAIVIWPIGLMFFLNGYIKARYGDKNNKNNK